MTGLTPDITEASVVRHGALRLTFADGMSGEVDVLAPDTLYERVRTGVLARPTRSRLIADGVIPRVSAYDDPHVGLDAPLERA
jgi:hypothetical protein